MEHVHLIITHIHARDRPNEQRREQLKCTQAKYLYKIEVGCSFSYLRGWRAIKSFGTKKNHTFYGKTDAANSFFFSFGHCQSHNRRKFNSMSSDFLGVCCFSPSSYCLIGKNEKKSLFALEREMTPANSGCSAIIVKNLNESPICRAAFPLLSFFSLII